MQDSDNEVIDDFLVHNKLIFKKYKPLTLIGKGTFSNVYLSLDIKTKNYVAIKTEKKNKNKVELLESEAYILYSIRGFGIPEVISYGKTKSYNILILPLLGKSLLDLFILKDKTINIYDICLIAIQILERIKWIHSNNIVYRDIKPENFLFGLKDPEVLYLIDFGLYRRFKSSKTGKHIKPKNLGKFTGTSRYASVYALAGYEQSRRDDIESIGYMIIYLMKKKLPWQGIKGHSYKDCYNKLFLMKKYIHIKDLCNGLPKEIMDYMNYVKSLTFEQEPNYNYLINLFNIILKKNEFNFDKKIFSWIRDSTNNYSNNIILKQYSMKKLPNNKPSRKSSPQNRLYLKIKKNLEDKQKHEKHIRFHSDNISFNKSDQDIYYQNENDDYSLIVMFNKNINILNYKYMEKYPKTSSENNIFRENVSFINNVKKDNIIKNKYSSQNNKIKLISNMNIQKLSDRKIGGEKNIKNKEINYKNYNKKSKYTNINFIKNFDNKKLFEMNSMDKYNNYSKININNCNNQIKIINKKKNINIINKNSLSHKINNKDNIFHNNYTAYNTYNDFNSFNEKLDKLIINNDINKICSNGNNIKKNIKNTQIVFPYQNKNLNNNNIYQLKHRSFINNKNYKINLDQTNSTRDINSVNIRNKNLYYQITLNDFNNKKLKNNSAGTYHHTHYKLIPLLDTDGNIKIKNTDLSVVEHLTRSNNFNKQHKNINNINDDNNNRMKIVNLTLKKSNSSNNTIMQEIIHNKLNNINYIHTDNNKGKVMNRVNSNNSKINLNNKIQYKSKNKIKKLFIINNNNIYNNFEKNKNLNQLKNIIYTNNLNMNNSLKINHDIYQNNNNYLMTENNKLFFKKEFPLYNNKFKTENIINPTFIKRNIDNNYNIMKKIHQSNSCNYNNIINNKNKFSYNNVILKNSSNKKRKGKNVLFFELSPKNQKIYNSPIKNILNIKNNKTMKYNTKKYNCLLNK